MCNTLVQDNIEIHVNVTEVPLTPLSCASLVNEVIKFLIYEKSQIPYPYNWLKSLVNKKRKSLENEEEIDKKTSISARKFFQVVSSAYDTLDDIMKNINNEFQNACNDISEVFVVFGVTPHSPKQIFSIRLPPVSLQHVESNHVSAALKNQRLMLKDIFLSQEWLKAMNVSIPLTNMYVMLRKRKLDTVGDLFIPNRQYMLPSKVKSVRINILNDQSRTFMCCHNLVIFKDDEETKHCGDNKFSASNNETDKSEEFWFQSSVFLKGFKDCFVNKVPLSELW